MKNKYLLRRSFYSLVLGLALSIGLVGAVSALGSPNPTQSGSTGLQGTISSPAPSTTATIQQPVAGRVFTSTPITVSGTCQTGLLIKVFSNSIFVGSVQCVNGVFSLQADLFSGQNDITARGYDSLDQASPDGNTVSVTFQDGSFSAFNSRVSLTSTYAKLGANPGTVLTWPIVLSGGSGPYAISVDWGDSSAASLQSVSFAGTLNITHVYQAAGVFRIIVKATDVNGQTAFLQLVGVGNGKVAQGTVGAGGSGSSASSGGSTTSKPQFLWWPFAFLLPLIGVAFWLGRRAELQAIHRQLEKQTFYHDSQS